MRSHNPARPNNAVPQRGTIIMTGRGHNDGKRRAAPLDSERKATGKRALEAETGVTGCRVDGPGPRLGLSLCRFHETQPFSESTIKRPISAGVRVTGNSSVFR